MRGELSLLVLGNKIIKPLLLLESASERFCWYYSDTMGGINLCDGISDLYKDAEFILKFITSRKSVHGIGKTMTVKILMANILLENGYCSITLLSKYNKLFIGCYHINEEDCIFMVLLMRKEYDRLIQWLIEYENKYGKFIPVHSASREWFAVLGTPEIYKHITLPIHHGSDISFLRGNNAETFWAVVNDYKNHTVVHMCCQLYCYSEYEPFIRNGGEKIIIDHFGEKFIPYYDDITIKSIRKFGSIELNNWLDTHKHLIRNDVWS